MFSKLGVSESVNLLLLLFVATISSQNCDCCRPEQDLEKCYKQFKNYQVQALLAIKSMNNEDGMCVASPATVHKMKQQLSKSEATVGIRTEALNAVIAAVSTGSITSAHVPIPTYYANLNAPANLSCESNNRQPLTACFWTRIFKGQPEVIIVDKGMKKRQDGVLYCSQDERKVGKCSLYIPSTQADHFGSWSCTLVTLDGQLLTGKVDISDDHLNQIYFSPKNQGLMAVSPRTSQLSTIVNSSEVIGGVSYDTMRTKLYWSTINQLFRCDRNNLRVENVFNTTQYGTMTTIEYDSLTGNLYAGAGKEGHIVACDAAPTRAFRCVQVVTGQGAIVWALALNPYEGTMYWTSVNTREPWRENGIFKAAMDGSGRRKLAEIFAFGISIDVQSKRLYWAQQVRGTDVAKIQSSNLEGGEIVTIAELSGFFFKITFYGQRLYMNSPFSTTIKSVTTAGTDLRVEYTGSVPIYELTVPTSTLGNRTNPCKGQNCAGLCLLTPASFRCLPWQ